MWRSHNAAQVDDFDAADFMEAKKVKRLDRFGAFSVACAKQAIEDAGIDLAKEDRERVGAMMGSALGGIRFAEEQLGVFLNEGIKSVDPSLALNVFGGAASCNIAIELGAQGPNSTNAMSCASGTIAIGDAFRAIRDGYADVMFAGGAEAPLAPLCFGAFAIIRAMSTRNDDPGRARRARSTRIATASSWARARRCSFSRSSSARWRAARTSTRRSWASAARTTRIT